MIATNENVFLKETEIMCVIVCLDRNGTHSMTTVFAEDFNIAARTLCAVGALEQAKARLLRNGFCNTPQEQSK